MHPGLYPAPAAVGHVRGTDVDCEDVADLRDDKGRAVHGVAMAELGCAWLSLQLAGKQAPFWLAADRLKADGCSGLLVQSFVPGSTSANIKLVLWRWGPDDPHRVAVHDPKRTLAGGSAVVALGTRGRAPARENAP